MRRAITLIELLICVAILAILSASLAFSTSQILGRSHFTGLMLHLDAALEGSLDALAGDVARSTDHESDGTASLRLHCEDGRAVTYRLNQGCLIREDGANHEVVLIAESASGEFVTTDDGVRVHLGGSLLVGWRTVDRGLSLFIPWPERTGVRP